MFICPLTDMETDLPADEMALGDMGYLDSELSPPPTAEKIKDVVASVFKVQKAQLEGGRRFLELARARQAAYLLCRDRSAESLFAIGAALHRDHTTVIHGAGIADGLLDTNPDFRRKVRECEQRLLSHQPPKKRVSVALARKTKNESKPQPEKKSKLRPCMGCGADFMSQHNGHRHCNPCRLKLSGRREFEGVGGEGSF